MIFNTFNKKKIDPFLQKIKPLLFAAIIYIIFSDIYFLHQSSDFINLGTLALFIFLIIYYKISSRISTFFAICLVIIMSINFIFTTTSLMTEKAALWVFLFIAVSSIQQWRENI